KNPICKILVLFIFHYRIIGIRILKDKIRNYNFNFAHLVMLIGTQLHNLKDKPKPWLELLFMMSNIMKVSALSCFKYKIIVGA
ncbi:MAG: hypothetical protein LC115_09155, partial [Bacteroidia bacterium]|nr:hypothetical protein [Bacteroidia bacterium]